MSFIVSGGNVFVICGKELIKAVFNTTDEI